MGTEDIAQERKVSSNFSRFLVADSSWRMASSIQGTAFAWLVASRLMVTSGELGLIQSVILVPAVVLLLLGGVAGDHFEPRKLLITLSLMALIGPAMIIVVVLVSDVGLTSLLCYALLWSTMNALVTPSRDSLLTKVSSQHIQQTVTIVGAASAGTGIIGFYIAGQLDNWGILPVIGLQAGFMTLSVLAIRTLPSFPHAHRSVTERLTVALTFRMLGDGFADAWQISAVRGAIVINVVTGLINAGVYLVALPIIARDFYGGTAIIFSTMLMSFIGGSFLAALGIYPIMPFRYPGRWLLLTLIVPAIVFLVVAMEPPFWAIIVLFVLWGANAAVWSAMARSIVQDAAPEGGRARILAIYNFGLVGTAPIGALIVGGIADWIGPMLAVLLVPATSIPLMVWGWLATDLWHHTHDS